MKRNYLWIAVLFVLLSGSVGEASDPKTAEKQLRQELETKVLSLRIPNGSEKLQFNSVGQSVGALLPAPWTTGGLLRLKQVSLKRGSLRIECERVLLALRAAKSSSGTLLMPILTGQSVRLDLELDSGPPDVDHIKTALSKIFEEVDVQRRIALYWQPSPEVAPGTPPSEKGRVVGILEGGRPVYGVKSGVVDPPTVLYAPDPEFTSEARNKHIQGTAVLMVIVNEKGQPEILEVVKALGGGLDSESLAAVSIWRFKPAVLTGQPVAATVNVEVTFRL